MGNYFICCDKTPDDYYFCEYCRSKIKINDPVIVVSKDPYDIILCSELCRDNI